MVELIFALGLLGSPPSTSAIIAAHHGMTPDMASVFDGAPEFYHFGPIFGTKSNLPI